MVSGVVADKPARLVAAHDPVIIAGPGPRFVSRGGEKLAAALDQFGVVVSGRRALDVGASTGGFTDCLLQAGATQVVAIDVGRNQLHERIRADPRVDSREQTDIRSVTRDQLGGPMGLAVVDVSFISVTKVIGGVLDLIEPQGDLVVLVKPQFEAGRIEASKGRGVISDPSIWRRTLGEVCDALEAHGAAIMGAMVSPLKGADGNVEFLIHSVVHRSPSRMDGNRLDDLVAAASADEGTSTDRLLADGESG